jgi:hypothetical protein
MDSFGRFGRNFCQHLHDLKIYNTGQMVLVQGKGDLLRTKPQVSLVPKWTRVGEYTHFRFLFLNFRFYENSLSWPVVAVGSLKAPGPASAFPTTVLHFPAPFSPLP